MTWIISCPGVNFQETIQGILYNMLRTNYQHEFISYLNYIEIHFRLLRLLYNNLRSLHHLLFLHHFLDDIRRALPASMT